MLRRQRIIRDRIHKMVDAALFALGFYLAFALRSNADEIGSWLMRLFGLFGGTPEIQPFSHYAWYVLLTVPAAMVLLSNYGFYARPLIASRRQTLFILVKVCTVLTVGVIILMFLNKEVLSRAVIILFGLFPFPRAQGLSIRVSCSLFRLLGRRRGPDAKVWRWILKWRIETKADLIDRSIRGKEHQV